MIISDQQLRAREYSRKRFTRLVKQRNEWQDIQEILADVENQIESSDDYRLLTRIGNKDTSQWKVTDKKLRVEALRFRTQALERQVLKIVADMDAEAHARGSYVGEMIHAAPTPHF